MINKPSKDTYWVKDALMTVLIFFMVSFRVNSGDFSFLDTQYSCILQTFLFYIKSQEQKLYKLKNSEIQADNKNNTRTYKHIFVGGSLL